jgi:glycogen debranching enzyme
MADDHRAPTATEEQPAPPDERPRKLSATEKSPYYIQATAALADEQTRVLKQGDTFGVFDHYGDIKPVGLGEEGLYHEGTRYLSFFMLGMEKDRPLFLSSTVKEDNELLTVDLTNPDIFQGDKIIIPRGTLHLFRNRFLWNGACYERLAVKNYGLQPLSAHLFYQYEGDFADIFEVRGTRRKRRGRQLDPVIAEGTVALSYEGLDGVVRRTRLEFSPIPASLGEAEARFDLSLPPHGETTILLTITCERGQKKVTTRPPFDQAQATASACLREARSGLCTIHSANEEFNRLLQRSAVDLHMMTSETPEGPYPYAGVPWFSTPFGRDGLITALECLWLNPELARGVLAYLAATQATYESPLQDAEPGKILHETRDGEMAALGEIPFGRYYGSVDSTPLFVMLAGAYFERTGNRGFIESIWPNIELALRWIDTHGDRDGDGFVEYSRTSPQGLVNQGWKDSSDAVMHADGSLAEGAIALCEVQGYVYAAKLAAAELAGALEKPELADSLWQQARDLQQRFEETFWCEDLSTYALALDGRKRPCRVRSSNAGHCLFTGIARPEHARRVAKTLLSPGSFSGWGIRTLAASEVRYNPMSYHNGSVWPHDNALIALGLGRYGFTEAAVRVLTGLFDASKYLDLHRLPELFCGFEHRSGEGPTLYPVACAPQAWSAAAVFLLLQACLGLSVKGPEIMFAYPLLPEFLREVQIHRLRVGEGSVDLLLQRHREDVGINVLRREGQIQICSVK